MDLKLEIPLTEQVRRDYCRNAIKHAENGFENYNEATYAKWEGWLRAAREAVFSPAPPFDSSDYLARSNEAHLQRLIGVIQYRCREAKDADELRALDEMLENAAKGTFAVATAGTNRGTGGNAAYQFKRR